MRADRSFGPRGGGVGIGINRAEVARDRIIVSVPLLNHRSKAPSLTQGLDRIEKDEEERKKLKKKLPTNIINRNAFKFRSFFRIAISSFEFEEKTVTPF